MKPFQWVLVGVGVVALALVGWNLLSTSLDSTARAPIDLVYASPQELIEMAKGVRIGPADAPVSIVEFADYSCPGCAAFATGVKPLLDLSYADDDRVQYVFYDYPFIQHSFLASRAARCAGDQGRYWDYHDALFRNQPSWSRMADPAGEMESYARDVGLDRGEFRSCLRSDRHADVVTANLLLGRQLGVDGTPAIMVNTGEGRAQRVSDFNDVAGIRALVDGALARLSSRAAPEGEEG